MEETAMKQLRVRSEEPKEQVKREGHLLERASAAELEQQLKKLPGSF